MVKQRERYKIIVLEPAKSRISQGLCPICEKPKNEWKRTNRYTCCSVECTEKHQRDYVYYGWQSLRLKALKRDNFTCVRCEAKPKKKKMVSDYSNDKYSYEWVQTNEPGDSALIGDHIIPIALGGDEWDINNVQTLCIDCNKIKTKIDAANIAKLRQIEVKQMGNRTLA